MYSRRIDRVSMLLKDISESFYLNWICIERFVLRCGSGSQAFVLVFDRDSRERLYLMIGSPSLPRIQRRLAAKALSCKTTLVTQGLFTLQDVAPDDAGEMVYKYLVDSTKRKPHLVSGVQGAPWLGTGVEMARQRVGLTTGHMMGEDPCSK